MPLHLASATSVWGSQDVISMPVSGSGKRFGCRPSHAWPLGSHDYVTPRGIGELGHTALRRILDA